MEAVSLEISLASNPSVRVWYSKLEVEVGEGMEEREGIRVRIRGELYKMSLCSENIFIVFGNIKNTCLLMIS